MLEFPLAEASSWAVELEWPQKVGCLLEVGPHCVDLVDKILHTDHAILSEILFNNLIVSQREALLVNLAITSFYNSC